MFGTSGKRSSGPDSAALRAICDSRATIEFDMDGHVLSANALFLRTMGCRIEDIRGKHHRMFLDKIGQDDPAYAEFWARLRRGEVFTGDVRRMKPTGEVIWLQGTYVPVPGSDGRPVRVLKLASDVTAAKLDSIRNQGRLDGLSRSLAVIEFLPDGVITQVNDNFLQAFGYRAEDVVGRRHAMLMPPGEADQPAYCAFWAELAQGVAKSAEFRRVGAQGREVWLQATYTPVRDDRGVVVRVVKFATDITLRVRATRAFSTAIERMAEGRLDHPIDMPLGPEFEPLRETFNEMLGRLHALIEDVARTVVAIRTEADAISTGGDDLARRSESQAATLGHAVASMRRIREAIAATTGRMAEGSALARTAEARADAGQAVAHEAIHAVNAIRTVSGQIGEITGVIDAIAFQTNLLALNAAVEAARAGEAGKGFAVVASEVRVLAQRSSAAAADIGRLIGQSSAKVEEGAALVQSSGDALAEIAGLVKDVAADLRATSDAASRQADAVGEVDEGLTQLETLTAENSDAAALNANNAAQLAAETAQLERMVSFFSSRGDAARDGRAA